MPYFVKIENRIVTDIIVEKKDCGGEDFPESEKIGQEFIKNELGLEGYWIETSIDGNFRYRYAAIGDYYDDEYDVFYPKKNNDDLVLDKNEWNWVYPEKY